MQVASDANLLGFSTLKFKVYYGAVQYSQFSAVNVSATDAADTLIHTLLLFAAAGERL